MRESVFFFFFFSQPQPLFRREKEKNTQHTASTHLRQPPPKQGPVWLAHRLNDRVDQVERVEAGGWGALCENEEGENRSMSVRCLLFN